MKHINKQEGQEPELFKEFKDQTDGASFKGLYPPAKRALKSALLREQGYICAYCMRQIDNTNTSIEHYLPQSEYPELSLDYYNLLAVCDGNQGHGKHLIQCDKKKSNKILTKVDPRDQEIEQLIFYTINGNINSADDDIESDLFEKLNLNNQRIVENRKVVIDAILNFVKSVDRGVVKKVYKQWKNRDDEDQYREFCQVGVYFFKKFLKQKY